MRTGDANYYWCEKVGPTAIMAVPHKPHVETATGYICLRSTNSGATKGRNRGQACMTVGMYHVKIRVWHAAGIVKSKMKRSATAKASNGSLITKIRC